MIHPKFKEHFHRIHSWLLEKRIPVRLTFIIMGILATVWFLIRVIPKPSRAAYPCMRTAFPIMAAFVIWLTSFTGAFVSFRKIGKSFRNFRYLSAGLALVSGLVFSAILVNTGSLKIKGNATISGADVFHPANEPMGTGLGIFPGRVIWNWNPDATDETCTNYYPDWYVMDSNTDQDVVNTMIENSIVALGGGADAASSWDAIFKYFNDRKGKGETGYTTGETIFIKTNEGSSSYNGIWGEPTRSESKRQITETTPQVVQAILKQLIEVAGVPQNNIWVADPKSHLWDETFEKLSAVYPDVNYGDRDDQLVSADNRTKLHVAAGPSVFYSDNGTVMPDAVSDKYDEELIYADYLINLAALKAHARAGITLTAKNHFGSHSRSGATHLHPGLVAPENDIVERSEYGMYRVQVDLMGSSILGGNTLLFLVDGLWSGTEAVEYPVKWTMPPFNNDWPSSIFMSLDQVALESVCFDFLRTEAEIGSALFKNRPNFAQGVDDYLHQAADENNWPQGISYDPDNSGTPVSCLGTHEHWNDISKKQYSINLGKEKGIELYSIPESLVTTEGLFEAKEASTLPYIDGEGDDECWKTVAWNPIDQLWIPWGPNKIPAQDFNGRFKIMWSSETNLIYLLVKTSDDAFIDGYIYPNGGYHNFDVVEVFVDEDRSGGPSLFDTGTENAENAFAYHIIIDQPDDGTSTNTAHVCDIAGSSWAPGDNTIPDYFSHFHDFTVKRDGNAMTWEFSFELHNDTYDHADPDASLVDLYLGKKLGLSVAYCDNDSPDGQRDNFFGSVQVAEEAYNNHYLNADDYGEITLVPAGDPINHEPVVTTGISDFEFELRNTEEVIVQDLSANFHDEDGDPLTYKASSEDPKLSFSVTGNTLKATALSGFRGPATVTIECSDDQLYKTSTTFSVVAVNHTPLTDQSMENVSLEAIGQTITVISNLSEYFSDPDGDILTYNTQTDDPGLTTEISQINSLKLSSSNDFTGPSTVTILASDGMYTVDQSFVVTTTVGIPAQKSSETLNIFPNPANDLLTFEFDAQFNGEILVRIIGVDGKIFSSVNYRKKSRRFTRTLDIRHLPPGLYFLEVYNQDAVQNMRFYKNR